MAKFCVLQCSPSIYVTSTIRTRCAQPIDITDSRGIRLVLISTTYYPLDPHLGYSTYTLISLSPQQLFYSKSNDHRPY
jgi:hypothetical protein